MTENSNDLQEPEFLEVTEAMITEAHKSFGCSIHESCPRCGSDRWNESGRDQSKVVSKFPILSGKPRDIHGAFFIDCANCGFLEHFLWRTIIDYVMEKRG